MPTQDSNRVVTALTPADRSAAAQRFYLNQSPRSGRRSASAVMTSFNKCRDVRLNLEALRRQTVKFDEIIVVDNHSSDGTQAMIRTEFPEVLLIEMPNSGYGACETFNIGFGNATGDDVAILDDDVILPEDWLAKMQERFSREPETTGLLSSKVVEPEEPEWYTHHPLINTERYMSTFRGCASFVKRDVLERAGYYDVRFFIYGNERDLTCRILNLGYRVLQYPSVVVRHGTPFGMKRSARSLYFHIRNLWLYLFKNVAWTQIVWFFMLQVLLALKLRKPSTTSDAVGTIGVFKTIRDTPRGWWIVLKATLNAFCNLPYCLKHRRVCRAPDFSLPVK